MEFSKILFNIRQKVNTAFNYFRALFYKLPREESNLQSYPAVTPLNHNDCLGKISIKAQ